MPGLVPDFRYMRLLGAGLPLMEYIQVIEYGPMQKQPVSFASGTYYQE